jgi:hypothetical protein
MVENLLGMPVCVRCKTEKIFIQGEIREGFVINLSNLDEGAFFAVLADHHQRHHPTNRATYLVVHQKRNFQKEPLISEFVINRDGTYTYSEETLTSEMQLREKLEAACQESLAEQLFAHIIEQKTQPVAVDLTTARRHMLQLNQPVKLDSRIPTPRHTFNRARGRI